MHKTFWQVVGACTLCLVVGCQATSVQDPQIIGEDSNNKGFALICTPDDHAQWLFLSSGAGNMVTALGSHGEPLTCDYIERTYHVRRTH